MEQSHLASNSFKSKGRLESPWAAYREELLDNTVHHKPCRTAKVSLLQFVFLFFLLLTVAKPVLAGFAPLKGRQGRPEISTVAISERYQATELWRLANFEYCNLDAKDLMKDFDGFLVWLILSVKF